MKSVNITMNPIKYFVSSDLIFQMCRKNKQAINRNNIAISVAIRY